MRMSATARRLTALASGAAISAVMLSACAPLNTQRPYDPSDGVRLRLEAAGSTQVRGSNLMILTEDTGAPGVLMGSLSNDTGEATTVTIALDEQTELTVALGPGETVYLDPLGTDDSHVDVPIESTPAQPGAAIPAAVSTGEAGQVTVSIPVLDGTLEPYADYLPS